MEQFTINHLTVRISENINYVWVLVDEQAGREQFAASLSDAGFHTLLQQHNIKNILIDCSKMWSFGIPEMSDYLDTEFTAWMRETGVEIISVVLDEQIVSMLSFIFQGIENNHAGSVPQIRFFPSSQFYESFESVNWF